MWLTRMTCGDPAPPWPDSEESVSKAGNCWPWQGRTSLEVVTLSNPGVTHDALWCGSWGPHGGTSPEKHTTAPARDAAPHAHACAPEK